MVAKTIKESNSGPSWPKVYMGCEGVNLLDDKRISLLLIAPSDGESIEALYIIDIQKRGSCVFKVPGVTNSHSLKTLLEGRKKQLEIVMWDPRPACHALYSYGVKLSRIEDAQLHENVTSHKSSANKNLLDLKDAVQTRLNLRRSDLVTTLDFMSMADEARIESMRIISKSSKKTGDSRSGLYRINNDEKVDRKVLKNFKSDKTGEVTPGINERPSGVLDVEIVTYCNIICCALHCVYQTAITSKYWMEEWGEHLMKASAQRLKDAQSLAYKPDPASMKQPPAGWPHLKRIDITRPTEGDNE